MIKIKLQFFLNLLFFIFLILNNNNNNNKVNSQTCEFNQIYLRDINVCKENSFLTVSNYMTTSLCLSFDGKIREIASDKCPDGYSLVSTKSIIVENSNDYIWSTCEYLYNNGFSKYRYGQFGDCGLNRFVSSVHVTFTRTARYFVISNCVDALNSLYSSGEVNYVKDVSALTTQLCRTSSAFVGVIDSLSFLNFGDMYCPIGYIDNNPSNDYPNCTDVNECDDSNGGCSQICTNLPGTYECSCKPGYIKGPDSKSCNDIDECTDNLNNCVGNSFCSNSNGTFTCECPNGYKKSADNRSCDDIDECVDVPKVCQDIATCENVPGSFKCLCPKYYELTSNKTACQDIDECKQNLNDCKGNSICNNTNGGFKCDCPIGYTSSTDLKSCIISTDQSNEEVSSSPKWVISLTILISFIFLSIL